MDRLTAAQIGEHEARELDNRSYMAERRANYAQYDDPRDVDRINAAIEKARPVFAELDNLPPNPLRGEDSRSFRLRMMSELKRHSEQYANTQLRSLARFPQAAFDRAEDTIVADAYQAAKVWAPEGTLRERRIPQRGGGDIVEYAGDPRVWLSAFTQPGRVVRKFMYPNSGGTPMPMPRRSVG
jgi:hypothetical protein